MARNKKQRINTHTPSQGFAAFASLDTGALGDLPLGPVDNEPRQPLPSAPPSGGKPRLILRKETAHRGGKVVIVVDGFPATHSDGKIESLAGKLRRACGCGGTIRERTIEIQGNQPGKIREILESSGYRAGGVR